MVGQIGTRDKYNEVYGAVYVQRPRRTHPVTTKQVSASALRHVSGLQIVNLTCAIARVNLIATF